MKQFHRRQFLGLGAAALVGSLWLKGCDRRSTAADFRQGNLSLQVITLPANGRSLRRLFVVLHGWGGNARNMAAVVPQLRLPDCQALIPSGPFPKPDTLNGRMWYGFPGRYNFNGNYDLRTQADLIASRQLLTQWLLSLAKTTGVPLSRTILAGFSQGGAMTLEVGLSLPVAGLVVLSGYLHQTLAINRPVPPILMVHGSQDSLVPVSVAQRSRDRLLAGKAKVEYHELSMGHTIEPAVLDLVRRFTLRVTS